MKPEYDQALFLFDQFHAIVVRIIHESDHGRAALDRSRLARHLAALCLDCFAGLVDVIHADGNVAVRGAQFVFVDAVVIR